MRDDFFYAIRSLGRSPVLTAMAILSLALGIGANASIFSLLDQVVLRYMDVKSPERLVILHSEARRSGWNTADNNETTFSYPHYKDLRDRTSQIFEGIAGRASASVSLRHGNESERATAELVTGNLFSVLQVEAALGRTLTIDDDKTIGAHPVVVLTHRYWKRRFGLSPAILNQNVLINGHPMTVVGVLPERLGSILLSATPDVVIPIAMKRQVTPTWDGLNDYSVMWLNLVARLRDGVSHEQAQAAVGPVWSALQQEHLPKLGRMSDRNRQRFLSATLQLKDGGQGIADLREDWQRPLLALMGMTGFVLLIACANVANLLMVKGAGRRKEIALRMVLGAQRSRVMRLLLVESLLLAALGAGLGLVVANWTTEVLLKVSGQETLTSGLDGRVLLFSLAMSLATGILFGLSPAFRATRVDWNTTLKESSLGVRGGGDHARMRKILVSGQMALCTVLLVAAGLFATSLYRLLTADPGFRTQSILQFQVSPKLSGYDQSRSLLFHRSLLARLQQMPGVESASLAQMAVLSGSNRASNVTVEGYAAKEEENLHCNQNPVGPGYFRTLGIPLLAGREFNERDDAAAPKAVIVNQTFARYFFGEQNPIGRHMTFGGGNVKLDREIVGVVKDSKNASLKSQTPRLVYSPYTQDEGISALNYYVLTKRDAEAMGSQIRTIVRELDPNIPLYELMTLKEQMERSVSSERLLAILSNAFALLATLLAALGLYGVISQTVTGRTGEFGIRLALGAQRVDVFRTILAEVGLLALMGMSAGLILALWLGKYLESQLVDMKAADPLIMCGAVVVLGLVALLAGYLPARRASRIDPMVALRHE